MSEFITIQVGQCGNQIGATFWPSILEEYGIQCSKEFNSYTNGVNKQYNGIRESKSFHSFFTVPSVQSCSSMNTLADLKRSEVKARSILVDMEDSVISKFKTGLLKDLFEDKCIISNYCGSGNNWAEGFCYHGSQYKSKLMYSIQRAVEKCDSLQGFIMLFSVGGGTGSGLGTYILNLLAEEFSEIERFVSCVYPTGTEDVITCPYNMVLSTRELTEHASCVFPVENRALLEIVSRQLYNKNDTNNVNSIIEFKPFHDMNNIISNMLLHLTSGSRFAGSMNVDIGEITTNMVPYPKLHFLSSSFSPILSSPSKTIVKPRNSRQIKNEIFVSASSRNNQLLKIDPLGADSVLLGSLLIGRGDYSVSDMRDYVERIRSKGHFTGWSEKAVKVGLCNVPPVGQLASMFCLFNTTAISTHFAHISYLYKKLYRKKAHLHHYTNIDGFDADFFEQSYESLLFNIESYKEMEKRTQTVPRLSALN